MKKIALFICIAVCACLVCVNCGKGETGRLPVVYTGSTSSVPTTNPSTQQSTEASTVQSTDPTTQPSTEPSTLPSTEPSTEPSTSPSTAPSTDPSTEPSTNPSTSPSTAPSSDTDNSEPTPPDVPSKPKEQVEVQVSATEVGVGDEVVFTITFNNLTGVKTFGVSIEYNDEYFELASAKLLITGATSGVIDGVAVIAFDECVDLDGQRTVQFVLEAKAVTNGKRVGFIVSVKGENDKNIVVSQPEDVTIKVS